MSGFDVAFEAFQFIAVLVSMVVLFVKLFTGRVTFIPETAYAKKPATGVDELDKLILSVAGVHWRKVAMIIALVEKAIKAAEGRTKPDEIAKRIVALVDAGHLEKQGNLSRWRYSEVRLPLQQSKLRHLAS